MSGWGNKNLLSISSDDLFAIGRTCAEGFVILRGFGCECFRCELSLYRLLRRLFNTNDWLEMYEGFVLHDLASVLLSAQVPFILRSDTMARHIGQGLSTQIQQGTVGITGGVVEPAYMTSPLIRRHHEKLLQNFYGQASFIIKGRYSLQHFSILTSRNSVEMVLNVHENPTGSQAVTFRHHIADTVEKVAVDDRLGWVP